MAKSDKKRTGDELPGAGSVRSARDNSGNWMPFVDWREVFPGNRGVDRNGVYDLFDAPVGIKLRVEPSLPSEPLLTAGEVPWEDDANMQPAATWRDDEGAYGIIYGAKDGMPCFASSEDGYHFVRPHLGPSRAFPQGRDSTAAVMAQGWC